MTNYPEKCSVSDCPCHEWSAESPSEPPTTRKGDAGFLVPKAENVSSGQETSRIDPYEYLRTFKYAPPDAESAQPAEITVPTFEQEWQDAPKWTTRTTEEISANYWFIRGQHAKEVELLAGMNLDLREMIRVARERCEL